MKYNKYSNKKTLIDGIKFDSKKEAKRYSELKLLLNSGYIKDLELQPVFILQKGYRLNGKKIRAIKYIADFRYYDNELEKEFIEDVKGMKTQVYRIKKKMFEYTSGKVITEI